MISSAIPSVKYSFSGSALMFTKGSTAIDLPSPEPRASGGVDIATDTVSACAKCDAVANRAAGVLASAFWMAESSHSGTSSRCARTLGTGSVKSRAMMACIVGPTNGGVPLIIS